MSTRWKNVQHNILQISYPYQSTCPKAHNKIHIHYQLEKSFSQLYSLHPFLMNNMFASEIRKIKQTKTTTNTCKNVFHCLLLIFPNPLSTKKKLLLTHYQVSICKLIQAIWNFWRISWLSKDSITSECAS